MYFEDKFIEEDLAEEIVKCENLKMIQLNLPALKKVRWLTTLPKLEEFFVYRGIAGSTSSKYLKILKMLAGEVPQLKRIYIRNNAIPFDEFGLDTLDEERHKLADAENLKVYFKTEETSSTGRLNSTECKFDKIEAMRVESEPLNNPLVTEYLTTKGISRHFYRRYRRYRR